MDTQNEFVLFQLVALCLCATPLVILWWEYIHQDLNR